jgi:hypothetical protein
MSNNQETPRWTAEALAEEFPTSEYPATKIGATHLGAKVHRLYRVNPVWDYRGTGATNPLVLFPHYAPKCGTRNNAGTFWHVFENETGTVDCATCAKKEGK